MSERVKQILHALVISAWYSEPCHENKNFAENRYATIKASTKSVMNFSGAPANTWLLALIYVCLLLNQCYIGLEIARENLDWMHYAGVIICIKNESISKDKNYELYYS
jgi:hypothetical protein